MLRKIISLFLILSLISDPVFAAISQPPLPNRNADSFLTARLASEAIPARLRARPLPGKGLSEFFHATRPPVSPHNPGLHDAVGYSAATPARPVSQRPAGGVAKKIIPIVLLVLFAATTGAHADPAGHYVQHIATLFELCRDAVIIVITLVLPPVGIFFLINSMFKYTLREKELFDLKPVLFWGTVGMGFLTPLPIGRETPIILGMALYYTAQLIAAIKQTQAPTRSFLLATVSAVVLSSLGYLNSNIWSPYLRQSKDFFSISLTSFLNDIVAVPLFVLLMPIILESIDKLKRFTREEEVQIPPFSSYIKDYFSHDGRRLIFTVGGAIVFSVCCEILGLDKGTRDFWDIVAYFTGGLSFHWLIGRLKMPAQKFSSQYLSKRSTSLYSITPLTLIVLPLIAATTVTAALIRYFWNNRDKQRLSNLRAVLWAAAAA